jgi:O-antigen ligase
VFFLTHFKSSIPSVSALPGKRISLKTKSTLSFSKRDMALGISSASTTSNLLSIKNSFKIFSQNPFLGTGFNVYRYVQKNQGLLPQDDWLENHAGAGADSSLLFVAATTGVIGLVCYLFYLIRLFKLPNLNYYVIPLLAHSLFLNSLFYPAVLVWLSILVAKEYKIPSVLS